MYEKQKSNFLGSLFLGLTISIGIIISAFIISKAMKDIKLAYQTIDVKGYAEGDAVADKATWTGSFSVRSNTLKEAYDKLDEQETIILRFIEKLGVPKDEIKLTPVRPYKIYKTNEKGYNTSDVEAYEVSRSFKINSSDVNLISKVSSQSSELISQDIDFNSQNPQYFCSNLDELKITLLGKAAKNARARANQLADSKVGAIREISQGVFQITPGLSSETSGYGMYDTSSINKKVKAVVTASFAIN